MDYKDKINLETNCETVMEDIAVPYIAETPVMSLDSVYSMLQPLDKSSKMWLIEKLRADIHEDGQGVWTQEDLENVISLSEEAIADGRLHTGEEVEDMIKSRIYAN